MRRVVKADLLVVLVVIAIAKGWGRPVGRSCKSRVIHKRIRARRRGVVCTAGTPESIGVSIGSLYLVVLTCGHCGHSVAPSTSVHRGIVAGLICFVTTFAVI